MGRVVSPTPTPLSSRRVVPALVASYDMHGRAVGLFYTQPTGQLVCRTRAVRVHRSGADISSRCVCSVCCKELVPLLNMCRETAPRPASWPSGKASASRAEDPGFKSRLRQDFLGVESYQ